ncbi:MAG: hypothetical protein HY040_10865 [Planctomycetes bacterium]|nr:hypothetical protein [Planctomycetota bacterium]
MEFRWIAIITLWTLLAGPVFDSPVGMQASQQARSNQAGISRTRTHQVQHGKLSHQKTQRF